MKSMLMVVVALLAFAGPAQENPGFVKVEWSEKDGETWTVEGLRDREAGVPMATNTVFAIGEAKRVEFRAAVKPGDKVEFKVR